MNNEHWDKISDTIKLLPERKFERSDILFIYTDDMKKFDEMNSEHNLTLKDIPADDLENFKNDFIAAGKQRINCYTCVLGHNTVTVDIDTGTTPMFLACKTCGKQATSHMYHCDQSLTPTWEWYAPNPTDCADYEMDHVLCGGLLLRPYNVTSVPSAELSQLDMKAMYEFNKTWKRKNPGWTSRQFKRAFQKQFPNKTK